MIRSLVVAAFIAAASLASTAARAEEGKVTPLFSTPLSDMQGKEGVVLRVEYAPGGSTPVHHHDAHAFVYVLTGSVVMQVKGQEARTLRAGDTYYEAPGDIHLVSRNASATEAATFIVVLVKKQGNPVLMPVK